MKFNTIIIIAFISLGNACICLAEEMPYCRNSVINQVTSKIGCTVGDANCWLSKGGFCTDYVEKMSHKGMANKKLVLKSIAKVNVRKGDIAKFVSRAHYALVERVVLDSNGKPIAIDVSEYNFGTCWVDAQTLVTDKYSVLTNRLNIPISSVDGGFYRYVSKK